MLARRRTTSLVACIALWLPSVAVASVGIAASASADDSTAAPAAFDFTLPRVEGGHWRLAEHRGQQVWLVLVAPWCGTCAGFVDDVAARLRTRAQSSAAAGTGDAPELLVISARDARGAPMSLAGDAHARLLVDPEDAVLRALDPADLPWLVQIDEDGRLVAAGGDLDALAPVAQDDGLWRGLVSRWRQVWGE